MIKFGTSGWRGLIARDFTFENVRVATQGIAEYLQAELKRLVRRSRTQARGHYGI